jgi:hypothetical protein
VGSLLKNDGLPAAGSLHESRDRLVEKENAQEREHDCHKETEFNKSLIHLEST